MVAHLMRTWINEQFVGRLTEGNSQLVNVVERNVPRASLDVGHKGSVQSSLKCQVFL